ncbi:MAG: ribonuclease Z [Bacteroidetes bacterium]|nr:ribonuclease Z [Bacteroidota bacterium]
MKISAQDKFTVLADDRDDLEGFASYLEHIIPKKFENDHLIIDLLSFDKITLDELLNYLKISTYHRSSKLSFVIVNTAIDVDEVPMEMIVVPTLQEAEDIIEMEEIERDLGF